MELKQYWIVFRKWIWLVILGAVLAGGTAYLISRSMTPVYQARATLMVSPGNVQTAESYSTLMASERLAQTYAQLLQSPPVMGKTLEQLGPGSSFSVSAMPVPDTQLLSVRVTGTDPQRIAHAANTLLLVFIDWQNEIQRSRYSGTREGLADEMQRVQADIAETEETIRAMYAESDNPDTIELMRLQDQLNQYRSNYSALLRSYASVELAEASSGDAIAIVSPAIRPRVAIRPQVMRNAIIAAIAGAALAMGLIFLIEYLDDTIKSPSDLESVGLTNVAAVQRVSMNGKAPGGQLFSMSQPKSLVSESYRTLRTNLQFSSLDKPLRSLVVTSAVATEGKTTTTANLAVVMAQGGSQVVLVDGDLRRSSVHKLFDLSNREGLTNALVSDLTSLDDYVHSTMVENLSVMPAGPVPPNPQELLGSQRMVELIAKLQEKADVVLVDTPPLLAVSDASVLAARADGVLVVVSAGQTRRAAVQQAVEDLRKVGANVVGGVLNKVKAGDGRGYYYYYSYYDKQEEEAEQGWTGRLRRLGRRFGNRGSQSA